MFLEKGYLNKMVVWWLLDYLFLTHVVQNFKTKHDDFGGKLFSDLFLWYISPIRIRSDAKILNYASEKFLEKGYLNKMVIWWLLCSPLSDICLLKFQIKFSSNRHDESKWYKGSFRACSCDKFLQSKSDLMQRFKTLFRKCF